MTETVIETARLRLRAHRASDLSDLIAGAGDWEVARWMSNLPYPYAESDGNFWIAHVRAAHAAGRPRSFALALRETDRLVGGVGLDGTSGDGSDEPALGYWLGTSHWGQGFAREAVRAIIEYGFATLGLASLHAMTAPENHPSQKVLRACGLQEVGEIELRAPLRSGGTRGRLFRISRAEAVL